MKHNLRLLLILLPFFTAWEPTLSQELPRIKSALYDHRGRLRVNDQPFFPILLYNAPTDDKSLQEFRAFGFNVLACAVQACDALPAQGFYGAIHVGKKRDNLGGVLFAMGIDSPALHFKQDLLKKVAESNAKVAAAAPGRPIMNALGYWEDEPTGVMAGKLPTKEKYEDLIATLEVSAPYLYPVPYQPIASVGEAMARGHRATEGKKPLVPILQLFTWEAKARYPTPAELRCMAFLALVEGAQGIGYYSYGHVTGQPKTTIASAQPELWKSVQNLNRDIAHLGPRLLGGEESQALTLAPGTPSVRMKVVSHDNELLAVLVNSALTSQEVQLVCQPAYKSGSVKNQAGKLVRVLEGTARLTLGPLEVEMLYWRK